LGHHASGCFSWTYIFSSVLVTVFYTYPDTVGEPISILRPTCLHAMFQAPLGSKKP
jgi:hypothetical protein